MALRRMRILAGVMAAVWWLGLGCPALASGDFEGDWFIDREDLLEALALREGLGGRPFVSPFLVNPFNFEEELLVFWEFEEGRFEFEDDD